MNEFDKDNLDFFLKTNQAEFEEWMEQATDQELQYAMQLIRQSRRELVEQELALIDSVNDTKQASDILKKFTLGTK
ncbi:MAG: hypothetical protein EBU08_07875 [Micrococcales bacterium]|nr:hypothetical protein [Micrococcales bacterium]